MKLSYMTQRSDLAIPRAWVRTMLKKAEEDQTKLGGAGPGLSSITDDTSPVIRRFPLRIHCCCANRS